MNLENEFDWLYQLGARLTGSPAHDSLIDRIITQLAEIGLQPQVDHLEFERWQSPAPSEVLLRCNGERVPVTAVFPYSGTTGAEGIAAEVVVIDPDAPDWAAAAGKIAVVALRSPAVSLSEVVGTWFDAPAWGRVENPQVGAALAGAVLPRARSHGVAAVIFAWEGVNSDLAAQYIPFTLPVQGIPAVFVSGDASTRLRTGAPAAGHLTVDMEIDESARTRTVWAAVDGTERPDETIIVVTHTDGVNLVEENGHLALLSLAAEVMANPLRRTVIFGFVAGHMRIPAVTNHGQAASRWLDDHPELWDGREGHRRAVAGLGLEHFGARVAAAESGSGATALEPDLLYATTAELAAMARQHWTPAEGSPLRISRPLHGVLFGEAEPLFDRGIPTISLVTAPDYLLTERQGDYVDVPTMRTQIESFGAILRAFDGSPSSAIGTVEPVESVDPAELILRAIGEQ